MGLCACITCVRLEGVRLEVVGSSGTGVEEPDVVAET